MNILKNTSIAGVFTAVSVFLLPFVFSRNLFYAGVNAKVFFWLTIITIAGFFCVYKIWVSKKVVIKTNLIERALLLSIFLFLSAFFLSGIFGVYFKQSLFSDIIRNTGIIFLVYIAFMAWWLSVFLSQNDWSLVRRAVALSASVVSFLMILGVEGLGFSGRLFGVINLDIPGLSFANTTFAGIYLFLAFVLTIVEWLRAESGSRIRKIISGLLLIQFLSPLFINLALLLGKISIFDISSPAIILGSARASSATVFIFIVWFVGVLFIKKIFINKTSILWGVWTSIFMVSVFGAIFLLFTPGSFIQEKYIEESTAARLIVWDIGFESFKDRPLLGWGPENFRFGFEQNFDNRLYLKENLKEIWFDRAHNVFVDTLVSVGIIGLLAYLVVIIAFIYVIRKGYKRGLINDIEMLILTTLPLWHFLQLQTGFDTVASYALGGVIIGYGLWIENETYTGSEFSLTVHKKRIVSMLILLLFLLGFYLLVINSYSRQRSMTRIFQTDDTQKQIKYINSSLIGGVDFEPMRLGFSSLINGMFDQLPKLSQVEQNNLTSLTLLHVNEYEKYIENYILINPTDYRARMNYVYLLLLKTSFGASDHLVKAEDIVVKSYDLSPSHPLTYALHALVYLYSGKIDEAKIKIDEGIALNPNIEFTQEIKDYILKQEANFPEITIIKLRNL